MTATVSAERAIDNQQIELLGDAALETELIRQGFEVARPRRDRGIDLVVYRERPFKAVAVQMKASAKSRITVNRKYDASLIIVYVLDLMTKPRFFVMSHVEAKAMLPAARKATKSWKSGGGWTYPTAPAEIEKALQPYENRWEWLR